MEACPKPSDLPSNARCKLVFHDYGDLRLGVAIAPTDSTGDRDLEKRKQVERILGKLAGKPGSLLTFAKDVRRADWLVHLEGANVYIAPVCGWLTQDEDGKEEKGEKTAPGSRPRYGPKPIDEHLGDWLMSILQKVARVRNLLSLTTPESGSVLYANGGIDVRLEMLRLTGKAQNPWEVVDWKNGQTVQVGEEVRFRVHNNGREPVDVSFLFVDSNYGIEVVFPKWGFPADNRVGPNKSILSPAGYGHSGCGF